MSEEAVVRKKQKDVEEERMEGGKEKRE